jgi:hypothetical protein
MAAYDTRSKRDRKPQNRRDSSRPFGGRRPGDLAAGENAVELIRG